MHIPTLLLHLQADFSASVIFTDKQLPGSSGGMGKYQEEEKEEAAGVEASGRQERVKGNTVRIDLPEDTEKSLPGTRYMLGNNPQSNKKTSKKEHEKLMWFDFYYL